MLLQFPQHFFWGTSTAAAQIETASAHSFKGIRSQDGHIFERTSDHELRRAEDAQHIKRFGTVYRCSVDWARLQEKPLCAFDAEVVLEYQHFFENLTENGTKIMFVLHHFVHPQWFENKGGWLNKENLPFFINFVEQCIRHFGHYVSYWNTFNEPNVYAANAYFFNTFPPHCRSIFKANKVIKHMGEAHNMAYDILKKERPANLVGISLNTALMSGTNFVGRVVAKIADYWYNHWVVSYFEKVDFLGLSYYAHLLFDPFLVSEIHCPGKLEKMHLPHDKMWAYKPEGLSELLRRFDKRYHKPIVITENGICTDEDAIRIKAIKDYLTVIHRAIKEGINVLGYIHWSTFDNFEWDLGPTYRFGLLKVDFETKNRLDTEGARFYEKVAKANEIEV